MRALLASGDWPARNPDRNIADLKAQIAACARGANELRRVAGEYGRAAIDAYMGHVMAYAEEAVRRLIGRLSDGAFTYEMDNGAHVSVSVKVDRAARTAVVDFAGTSAPAGGQFQRALFDLPGGDALRLPHPGRRSHPPERRLHAADHARSCPKARCSTRVIRPRSWRAMSRPARWSPTACSRRWARWRRARGR